MSQLDLEAVNPIAPLLGKIRAIAVTTSSARFDIAAMTEFGSGGDDLARVFRFEATGGDVYIAFNTSNAGSIDETNTTASNATQCAVVRDGTFKDYRLPYVRLGGGVPAGLATWILVKGSVACTLRVSLSSEDPVQRMG
jgi:hypothetical protein